MGEGYRCLAAFKFDKAEEQFRNVLDAEADVNEEVLSAIRVCDDWREFASRYKNRAYDASINIDELYVRFRHYNFYNTPGLQQFQNSLLHYIAEFMISANRFYLDENTTVSDILLEISQRKKAEKVIIQRLENTPADHYAKYCIAEVQWKSDLKGAANKNYADALLCDPCRIPFSRIHNKQLKALIQSAGAEMAPCFGWVRGILPLIPLQADVKPCNETHRKALESYRLLRSADKALVKNDMELCYKYRKELYEHAPDLYREYFKLLQRSQQRK